MMNWLYLKLEATGKIKVVLEELLFVFYCFLRVIIVTSRHSPKVKVLLDVIFPSSGSRCRPNRFTFTKTGIAK